MDTVTKDEVIISKRKIINILLNYYNTNCFDNFYKCIFSFSLAVENDSILFDELEKNNFFENIFINQKNLEEKNILYYLKKYLEIILHLKQK